MICGFDRSCLCIGMNSNSYNIDLFIFQGSRVWLLEGKDWVPATVTESKGAEVTFRTEYDKVKKSKVSSNCHPVFANLMALSAALNAITCRG